MTSCVHMKQQWTAHAHADELNIALLNKTHLVSSCFMIFCKESTITCIPKKQHTIIDIAMERTSCLNNSGKIAQITLPKTE
ncbi:hypothetical protein T02_2281 [Trichinella nativa]|uniref:Uncharacterized protein n=1 Tax=Trichinella nativa TaxID=6335 RepID=A0A0V1LDS3_9BILA|nr:hypothetical protein T02_2281 [Trichinella nativa]